MTDNLHSDEDMTNSYEIGRAEGMQKSHADAYPEGLKAGRAEGRKAGFEQGKAEGAQAYRQRVKTILESPAARGREAAARHLALETDMTSDAAIAALATMRTQPNIGARAEATFSPLDPTSLQ